MKYSHYLIKAVPPLRKETTAEMLALDLLGKVGEVAKLYADYLRKGEIDIEYLRSALGWCLWNTSMLLAKKGDIVDGDWPQKAPNPYLVEEIQQLCDVSQRLLFLVMQPAAPYGSRIVSERVTDLCLQAFCNVRAIGGYHGLSIEAIAEANAESLKEKEVARP